MMTQQDDIRNGTSGQASDFEQYLTNDIGLSKYFKPDHTMSCLRVYNSVS